MGRKQNVVSDATTPVEPKGLGRRSDQTSGTDAAPLKAKPLEVAVSAALRAEKIRDARKLVANAEAILAGHSPTDPIPAEPISRSQIAAAKVRIAIAIGDSAAARAILVQAIEADPKTKTLRSLMTEVMMAEGRATDVRPVLKHLGNAPKRETTGAEGPSVLDTSR